MLKTFFFFFLIAAAGAPAAGLRCGFWRFMGVSDNAEMHGPSFSV
jgi:hypothetical protein